VRISDLLAIEELGLRLLCGPAAAEFGSVLVTDLPDPARYLTGGELVLTGLVWHHGPADSLRFVRALRAAGVAALGAGRARLGHIPDDLIAACQAEGLALLDVPTSVAFARIGHLAAPRLSGDVRAALDRHRRLLDAVAEGADLAALFALTAADLRVRGAVVSPAGEVIVGSAADPVRLARAYLTAPRLPCREGEYTLFSIGRGHRATGWALACAGDLLDRADVGFELAAAVALGRARGEEGRRVERRLAGQLITAARSGAADPAELTAGLRTCGLSATLPYAVVSVAAEGHEPGLLGGQMLEELLGRSVVAAPGPEAAVALVPLSGTADELAERLRAGTAILRDPALSIGVSGALVGAAAIRGGAEEAGHARRLAAARGGAVVTSNEIYTHALLLATVPGDVRGSFAGRLLRPLLDYDSRHQSELVRTLNAFLDCAGSWNTSAELLHVHVNTVRYRIRRVEELTGRDLSTMADRVDFFLALRST